MPTSPRKWWWVEMRSLGWHRVLDQNPRSLRLPYRLGCGKTVVQYPEDAPNHRLFILAYTSLDSPPRRATDVCSECVVHSTRKVDDVP